MAQEVKIAGAAAAMPVTARKRRLFIPEEGKGLFTALRTPYRTREIENKMGSFGPQPQAACLLK